MEKNSLNLYVGIVLNTSEKISEHIAKQLEKEYLDGLVYLNGIRKKDPVKNTDSAEEKMYKKIMENRQSAGEILSYEKCKIENVEKEGKNMVKVEINIKVYEKRKNYELNPQELKFLIQDVAEIAGIYARNYICNDPGIKMDLKEMKLRKAKITKKNYSTGSYQEGLTRDYEIENIKKNIILYKKRNSKSELLLDLIILEIADPQQAERLIIGRAVET